DPNAEPEIFGDPVDTLKKSPIYPYGLSDPIVERLHEAGINTVRDLYDAEEDRLDAIPYIGEFRVKRLKNAVAQAIWL
ncbi:MAG TPA: helix-hairpin-helix domain-containing protein, partial [Candidatus Acidoferrales bacterium]|nr:helix-hairpin-helix domain-containing protein [Candidatus Acidoferrales bacterium]